RGADRGVQGAGALLVPGGGPAPQSRREDPEDAPAGGAARLTPRPHDGGGASRDRSRDAPPERRPAAGGRRRAAVGDTGSPTRVRRRGAGGMLLWMSSSEFKIVWCGDELVELAGDVAFEAADDLLLGQAVFGASFHVGAGAGVPAQAADGDPVERFVGLSVAAAVEAVPAGLAGRGGDRGGTAEHGERRLRT